MIDFSTANFCRDEIYGSFELLLDKGTFDAISLSGNQKDREYYASTAAHFLRQGSDLLLTSCNWTEPELTTIFEEHDLLVADRLAYPTFSFGGQAGSRVCTVLLRHKYARSHQS